MWRCISVVISFASLMTAMLFILAMNNMVPHCPVPNGVSSTSLQTGTPPALLQALQDRVGEFAAPGTPFDATDVVFWGQNRRLIFFWNVGNRWIVATEHGGFGYNNPIFAYDLSEDRRSAALVQERIAFPDSVCEMASSLLSFDSS